MTALTLTRRWRRLPLARMEHLVLGLVLLAAVAVGIAVRQVTLAHEARAREQARCAVYAQRELQQHPWKRYAISQNVDACRWLDQLRGQD